MSYHTVNNNPSSYIQTPNDDMSWNDRINNAAQIEA